MKKFFLTVAIAIPMLTIIYAFKPTNAAKKYGGSASVNVEAVKQTNDVPCATRMLMDKVTVGNKRVIDVTVDCKYSTSSDAKEALLTEIKSERKCYEKNTSSISYDINSCDSK